MNLSTFNTCLNGIFKQYPLPRLEQLTLAAYALNVPRSWLLSHDLDPLSIEQINTVIHTLNQRIAGNPVAYIIGHREFYGLSFKVSPAVLIPRPETELLVDWLIANVPKYGKVLDLGTGSGAIAISLRYHRPDCSVSACDISQDALAIAARNNVTHTNNTVNLIHSNWCSALLIQKYRQYFDVVVSNPPYIAMEDPHLKTGDLLYEPIGALTDYSDGLKHYHTIAIQSLYVLKPSGVLLLEHGWQQGKSLTNLLYTVGYSTVVQHYDAYLSDQLGHERMVVANRL